MGSEKELTISQALRKIKTLKGKIAKHSANAMTNVTHRTDNAPAYSFENEWEIARGFVDELLEVQARVAIANAKTMIDFKGKTRSLAWCTKKLIEIKGAIAWYSSLSVRAQEKTVEQSYEYGGATRERVTIEHTCHLPEAKRAECIQALEAEFGDLNDLVENINHRTLI